MSASCYCEVLQTPGELRQRASRMASFSDVSQVETVLERLTTREDGPFVVRLAREPGRREARYAHLFSGPPKEAADLHAALAAVATSPESATGAMDLARASAVAAPEVSFPASRTEQRLTELENEMRALRAELEDVKRRLNS